MNFFLGFLPDFQELKEIFQRRYYSSYSNYQFQIKKSIKLFLKIYIIKEITMHSLIINGTTYQVDVEDEMPLLWVLRDELGMTGTKFGCGIGQCGACTVHVNGEAFRSCILQINAVKGKEIITIEGLDENHPVQKAWIEEQVPQCGYCISGQIMATSALLSKNLKPSESEIENKISNICRCGNYVRLRKAIRRSAKLIQKQGA